MTIGIRDTRKIDAAYDLLTEADVRGEARFADSVGSRPSAIAWANGLRRNGE